MRQKKDEPPYEADLSTPLDLDKLVSFQQEGDCFGKECDPKELDCSACASLELCIILTGEEVKKKEKELEDKQGPYLDSVNQDAVPWDKLEKLIETRTGKQTNLSVSDVIDWVMKKAKTKDRTLAVIMVRNFVGSREKVYTREKLFHYGKH